MLWDYNYVRFAMSIRPATGSDEIIKNALLTNASYIRHVPTVRLFDTKSAACLIHVAFSTRSAVGDNIPA